MRMNKTLALIALSLVTAIGAHADEGFKSIFDGKTFAGWNAADMKYWSIEDGAITGKINKDLPLAENLYLIWQGGKLADFELKLKSRVFGSPSINNGFQFRSEEMPNHDVKGYQVDNNLDTDWLVRLYDEHGRETLAWRGESATFNERGERSVAPIPSAQGPAKFKVNEWHEYHLICEGPHITLKVNDEIVAEVFDNDPVQQDFAGILGLQLHTHNADVTVQFKDIQLKVLDKKK